MNNRRVVYNLLFQSVFRIAVHNCHRILISRMANDPDSSISNVIDILKK